MDKKVRAKVFTIQQDQRSKQKMSVGFGENLDLNKDYSGAVNGGLIDQNSVFVGGYVDNSRQIKGWQHSQEDNSDNFNTRNGILGCDKQGHIFLKKTGQNPDINSKNTQWAIQNGPILIKDGKNLCNSKTSSKNIRTGIGYNDKNELVVIATEEKVTPFEFAEMFKKQGCKNAVYLDGFPEKSDKDPVGYKFKVEKPDGSVQIEEDKMQEHRPLLQFFHAKITEKEIKE